MIHRLSVADPGFLRRECQPLSLRQKLLFGKISAENCMKIKEIGPGGTRVPGAPPLGSTNDHGQCNDNIASLNRPIVKTLTVSFIIFFRRTQKDL